MGMSCLCPTFGRANLLEESIESFLRQEEDEKELIILNDADWQTLELEPYDNIRLYNSEERFPDMGSKWNWLVREAIFDNLVPWPSDDIMLPWALSTLQALLWGYEYVHPLGRFVFTSRGFKNFDHHGCQGIIAFTKGAHEGVGGYPKQYGGQDTVFLHKLRKLYGTNDPKLDESTAFFCYRWFGIPLHLSGIKTDERWEKLAKQMQKNYPEAVCHLNPHWDMDYVERINLLY